MWLVKLFMVWVPFCVGFSDEHNAPEKKFELNFDSDVYVCDDTESMDFIDTSELEAVRYNETMAYMTGNFKFLKGLGPQTMIELLISKETNGRLEVVATHEICDLCEELGPKDEETMYTGYLESIGFPDACPIEAGTYDVTDMIADTSDFPVNAGNVGKYQVTVNMYHDPDGSCKKDLEFLGCVKLDMVIESLD